MFNWLKNKLCDYYTLLQAIDALGSEVDALKVANEGMKVINKDIAKSTGFTLMALPITYEQPVKINYKTVQDRLSPAKPMFISDKYWYGINRVDVLNVLDRNPHIADMEYIKTNLDCDDFATALHGLFSQPNLGRFAFGYAVSKTHAFNFFVDRKSKIWLVEPQTNQIIEYNDEVKDNYKIKKWFI